MDNGSKKADVAAELNEAVRNINLGRFEEAQNICDRILVDDSDNVEALNILGGSLARAGKIAQAKQAAERVCSLRPGNPVFYSNLSYLHSAMGDVQKAILVMAYAVKSDTKNTVYQTKFARLADHLEFYRETAESAVIKDTIKICIGNPDVDAGLFSMAWQSLLALDPVFIKFATITGEGDFKEQADQVNIKELAGLLTDPFLLLGLKSLQAMDAKYERIMTFFRYYFIAHFDDYDAELFLPFLCALAEHCNLNEHVYSCTREELKMVDALEGKLDFSTIADAGAMATIALISCYKDLMQLDYADQIAAASADSQNDAFMLLIKNTISIPTKIRGYHDTISAVSSSPDSVQNIVSSSVARQYEENPYPRWRHLHIPVLTEEQRAKGRGKKILVAGCGTGHEPLNLAAYPGAYVLGVDLSVPSLAYGKQKAVEFGIDNVEFEQVDILQFKESGQQFDIISCAGVLHHMQDPVEGWSKLLNCLKPDGIMKIALYSEVARKSMVLCRNWIEEQGFESTSEGIRDFRQGIMELDDANPLRDILNWTDFFTMSMCRDLVFHVQEHRVTVPWIKSVLGDLGLYCISMRINNPFFMKEYLSMYPDDPKVNNLDNLHEYEKHNPRTFRDMYQFMCCRQGSATVKNRPAWFYTAGLS